VPANAHELQPDELEALQAETPSAAPAALVTIEGPVRVQDLPRKQAASVTRTIGTVAKKYLSADHRRASVKIMSIGQNVLIAFNLASAADPSTMAEWPAGTAYTLTADSDVWLAAKTSTTQVSIITEYWATGE
jgi:hypothetical protein